ncbi:MAG TPA: methionine adenosyltransferase [Myxococcota bacterium]|jgi:S-adenosylmethionine synthetase|nr:methionine adenosyltransferase [Myxococcota bacterium]
MFTSESVTEGHPDKLCDQISDAIVDRFLQQDPLSRINAECAVSTGILFVAAHFASEGRIDVPGVAREVIREIGYEEEEFDARRCSVMTSLVELRDGLRPSDDERSLDDDAIERLTAVDQVTTFGFACRHTPSLMPLPIVLAHDLARRLAALHREGKLPYLGADGKTQVGVEFHDRRPARIHGISIVASLRRDGAPPLRRVRDDVHALVIEPAFAESEIPLDARTRIVVAAGGDLLVGGPALHSGLTGRKTGVDTYGEFARHSGAALSGKDPSRIDRIGAYAARHVAKNVVAAGLADECEVQLSYTIGVAHPVSVELSTAGTGRRPDSEIARRVRACFDLRVGGIVRAFDLRHLPSRGRGYFFRRLAAYGQVGREDLELPWEATGAAAALR